MNAAGPVHGHHMNYWLQSRERPLDSVTDNFTGRMVVRSPPGGHAGGDDGEGDDEDDDRDDDAGGHTHTNGTIDNSKAKRHKSDKKKRHGGDDEEGNDK